MLYEIIGTDLNTWEQVSFYYTGDYSLLDLQKILYEKENAELDVQTTLENYLDHKWLEENILVIENTFKIMDTPLKELLNGYKIYEMVAAEL